MKHLVNGKSLSELINGLEYECDLMRDMCVKVGEKAEGAAWNLFANKLHDLAHEAFNRGLQGRLPE